MCGAWAEIASLCTPLAEEDISVEEDSGGIPLHVSHNHIFYDQLLKNVTSYTDFKKLFTLKNIRI